MGWHMNPLDLLEVVFTGLEVVTRPSRLKPTQALGSKPSMKSIRKRIAWWVFSWIVLLTVMGVLCSLNYHK
jgi:uncharacterized membrane protein